MKYKVLITSQALEDIFEIYKYVAINDSLIKASKLYNDLKQKCLSLIKFPNRGHRIPEVTDLGTTPYLEIHYKPYRIIYKIIERTVFVNSVLDGRRNLTDLLQKRLLR